MNGDDGLPPDPSPSVILVENFRLRGQTDDGEPFERNAPLAIIEILPDGSLDSLTFP